MMSLLVNDITAWTLELEGHALLTYCFSRTEFQKSWTAAQYLTAWVLYLDFAKKTMRRYLCEGRNFTLIGATCVAKNRKALILE